MKKIISIIVLQAFLLQSAGFAAVESRNDIGSISIPRDIGTIRSEYKGKSDKFIIHIQDAHCNYEAQTNISKILEKLYTDYGVGLVSVEGAYGDFDTRWFKSFPDAEVRRDVADYFVKKGEITGAEFLSIIKDYPISLYGAENKNLYIKNLNAFTKAYSVKGEVEKYLGNIKSVLGGLKRYIYSLELKGFDAKVEKYDNEKISLAGYARHLESGLKKHRLNIRDYPNLEKLNSTFNYEKRIDFKTVNTEREKLIDKLTKALSQKALNTFVRTSVSFRNGTLSSGEYHAYLKKLAGENKIDMSGYPGLSDYAIYAALYEEIESEKLFAEFDTVKNAIKAKLFKNDDERLLSRLWDNVNILSGIANLGLVNKEYEYFKAHRGEFKPEFFTSFLRSKVDTYNLALNIEDPPQVVKDGLSGFEKFYEVGLKRDRVLVENTLKAMREKRENSAVLITGGFHTEGMKRILESKGYSYVVMCPSITKDAESPYINVLTNKGLLAAMQISQLVSMSPEEIRDLASRIEGLENGPDDRMEAFVNAWIEEYARTYGTEDGKFTDKGYFELMLARLKSSDPDVRKEAVDVLKAKYQKDKDFTNYDRLTQFYATLPVSSEYIFEKSKETGKPVLACNIDTGELSELQMRSMMRQAVKMNAYIIFEVGSGVLQTYADGKPQLPEYCARAAMDVMKELGKAPVYAVHLDHNQINKEEYHSGNAERRQKAIQEPLDCAEFWAYQGGTSYATDTSTITIYEGNVAEQLAPVIETSNMVQGVIEEMKKELGVGYGVEVEVGDVGTTVTTVEEAKIFIEGLTNKPNVLASNLGTSHGYDFYGVISEDELAEIDAKVTFEDLIKKGLIDKKGVVLASIEEIESIEKPLQPLLKEHVEKRDQLKPFKSGTVNTRRAKEIYDATGVPNCLHGFSGTDISDVPNFIGVGIVKVNISTDWQAIVWKVIEVYYPELYKRIFKLAREAARDKGSSLVTDDEEYDYSHARNRIIFGKGGAPGARKLFRGKKGWPLLEEVTETLRDGDRKLPVAETQEREDHVNIKLTIDKTARPITALEAIEKLTGERVMALMEALGEKDVAEGIEEEIEKDGGRTKVCRIQPWQVAELRKAVITTPGVQATGRVLKGNEPDLFDDVLRSNFKTGKAHEVPRNDIVEGFQFVTHDGFIEVLDARKLPINVHPGRGGDIKGHGLLQAHVDSFIYENLAEPERRIVAFHELAHIWIFNIERMSDAERDKLDKRSRPYRIWKAWVVGGKKMGKAQERFVNNLGTQYDTRPINKKIKRLAGQKRQMNAAKAKQVLANIDAAEQAVEQNENPPVVSVISGSEIDQENWRTRLTRTTRRLFRRNGTTKIESLQEKIGDKTREGNFLGTLLAYRKLREARSGKVWQRLKNDAVMLIGMLFGRGERMSPYTQVEGNRKPAIGVGRGLGGNLGATTAIEEALHFFAPIATCLKIRGFRGILDKWGDETQIPSIDLSNAENEPSLEETDVLKVVSVIKITDELAQEKDWVVFDEAGNMVAQLSRNNKEVLIEQLRALGIQPRADGEYYAGVSLGPVGISYDVLDIAEEVFVQDIEQDGVYFDFDPYLLMALSMSGEGTGAEWDAAVAADTKLQGFAENYQQLTGTDFFEKVQRVRELFLERRGRELNLKVFDLGENVYWADIGQHKAMRTKFMALNDDGPEGVIAKQIEGIGAVKRDANGNILINSTIAPGVNVRNAVIINSELIGEGDVVGGVVKDSTLHNPAIDHAFCVSSTRANVTLKPQSGIYKSIGAEPLTLEEGMRHGTLLTSEGPVGMKVHEDTNLRDKDSTYNVPILDNTMSFAAAYDEMLGVSVDELERRQGEAIEAALEGIRLAREEETREETALALPETDPRLHSQSGFYQLGKQHFGRSSFGLRKVYGTSGFRESLWFLRDFITYGFARGSLSFFDMEGQDNTTFVGGDYRPTTPDISLQWILAALSMGKNVVNLGNVPTPAVALYGIEQGRASLMVTASHTPVGATDNELEKGMFHGERGLNGGKQCTRDGEVLKTVEELCLLLALIAQDEGLMKPDGQQPFHLDGLEGALGAISRLTSTPASERGSLPDFASEHHPETTRVGSLKSFDDLSPELQELVERAREILEAVDDGAEDLYCNRYVGTFGQIFDEDDHIAFLQHMAVGGDGPISGGRTDGGVITRILSGLGATVHAREQREGWVMDEIVDTEDVKPGLERMVQRTIDWFKGETAIKERMKTIFSVDGDTDRPAVFSPRVPGETEKPEFIYGNKLNYVTCEFLREQVRQNTSPQEFRNKKFYAAVTATCSNAVIARLEKLGFEVEKLEIGSPYIVEAMQRRQARARQDGEDVYCMGFERNGGFLLGSDIPVKNKDTGKVGVLKALATRDAVLPVIAATATAKERGLAHIGLLFDDLFGEDSDFPSYEWSGLVEATTSMPTEEELIGYDPLALTAAEKVAYEKICENYTATMGQAIMRSFSPLDVDIVEVKFDDNGDVRYLRRGDPNYHTANAETANEDNGFAQYMTDIRARLEAHWLKDARNLPGRISQIDYLDGVRMYFRAADDTTEVIHMRPSGNAPQWRLYTEAATLHRARQMTLWIYETYPPIIAEYLENKRQFEGVSIVPRNNDRMKQTVEGLPEFDQSADDWNIWDFHFVGDGGHKHRFREDISFKENNEGVSWTQTFTYKITDENRWMVQDGFEGDSLEIERSITYSRRDGSLTCAERYSDGRGMAATLVDGDKAWLEIGRGLDKNIPMGKFRNKLFPVISDTAYEYFRERGIYWLDVFDIAFESEFTTEGPMWARNFDFVRKDVEGISIGGERETPGVYSASGDAGEVTSAEAMEAEIDDVCAVRDTVSGALEANREHVIIAVEDGLAQATPKAQAYLQKLYRLIESDNISVVRGNKDELEANVQAEARGKTVRRVVTLAASDVAGDSKFRETFSSGSERVLLSIDLNDARKRSDMTRIPHAPMFQLALQIGWGYDTADLSRTLRFITDQDITEATLEDMLRNGLFPIIPRIIPFDSSTACIKAYKRALSYMTAL